MRSEGSSRSEPARRGRLSFARTCIRYLRERILYSVNTNTRRQAKLIVVLLTGLGNAVGAFNEYKSSRADSEYRFSFFGEAKKSKCPVGMKRMVKTIVAPIKSYTRRRVADSTNSTARRANAVQGLIGATIKMSGINARPT